MRLQQVIREKYHGELLVGQAEIIPTGDAEVPWLVSAPTMRVPMHVKATINAYLAMRAILLAALHHSVEPAIDTVAVPGLGTGVGDLRHDIAARQMWTAYQEVILGLARFPQDLGQAVDAHLKLNPLGMLFE
ncbi:MAG: macro domain-containing protein [Phycisphaerae bacterium]|nr:macro domain-containing protein [Phycisphaerae bacterium]